MTRNMALCEYTPSSQTNSDVLDIYLCREGVETRYIVRTLVQNLRVNANWWSIIGPLARAVIMHRDGAGAPKAALDAAAAAALDAFHTCPSLDLLVPALVEGGIEEMRRRCSLTPGDLLCPALSTRKPHGACTFCFASM